MDLFTESHHSSEQKYFRRIGRTRVRDPGKGQAESAGLDVRVKHGRGCQKTPKAGVEEQEWHNHMSPSPKGEQGKAHACVARGQKPPGTPQEAR